MSSNFYLLYLFFHLRPCKLLGSFDLQVFLELYTGCLIEQDRHSVMHLLDNMCHLLCLLDTLVFFVPKKCIFIEATFMVILVAFLTTSLMYFLSFLLTEQFGILYITRSWLRLRASALLLIVCLYGKTLPRIVPLLVWNGLVVHLAPEICFRAHPSYQIPVALMSVMFSAKSIRARFVAAYLQLWRRGSRSSYVDDFLYNYKAVKMSPP